MAIVMFCLLINARDAQVSDTTDDDSSAGAGYQRKYYAAIFA